MARVRWRTKRAASRYRPELVLRTSPQICDANSPLKVWLLTGNRDMFMSLWALKSLILNSNRKWDVWIADDGTINDQTRGLLEAHLIGAHVMKSEAMDHVAMARLQDFPLCSRLRREFVFARKLFDPFFHLTADRYLVLDSDILFFSNPNEIVAALLASGPQPNWFCRQAGSLSTFTEEEGRRLIGCAVMEDCNAGLVIANRESIILELIEKALAETQILTRWRHVLEQSLYAMLSTRYGFQFLPPTYQVHMGSVMPSHEAVCTHYVVTARDQFYSEGIRYFLESGRLVGVQ
jgi:lipopolysaccharide biosynthesis glycosyltransferase